MNGPAVKPLILVSNDDGVNALGIIALRKALETFADVVVVAPKSEQSAQSHSITLHHPLRHDELADDNVHAIDGTPVDCVYVALFRKDLLPRTPDLCASGINHGANLASDVVYSGTVAAAREATLRGVPAIAFSTLGSGEAHFEQCAQIAAVLCRRMLDAVHPPTDVPLLNVNFPKTPSQGIRATRLGRRHYAEGVAVRRDPRGREYYWIGGPGGVQHHPLEGSDTDAVDAGFVSVTPLRVERTHPEHLGLAAFVAGPKEEET